MNEVKMPQGLAIENFKNTIVKFVTEYIKENDIKYYFIEPFFTSLANEIRSEAIKELQEEEKEYKGALDKQKEKETKDE